MKRRFTALIAGFLLLLASAGDAARNHAAAQPAQQPVPMDSFLAFDPLTGRVLLEYDPNHFLSRPFPTGSLIKIFTVIAALRQNPSLKNFTVVCPASAPGSNVFDTCWYHPGHGTMTMNQAIAYSCNRYFRVLGEKIRPSVFWSVLREYGLITDEEEKEYRTWTQKEVVQAMVGTEDKLKMPPRRFLIAYAALYNGGVLFTEDDVCDGNNTFPIRTRRIQQNAAILTAVKHGMEECCIYGSGTEARSGLKPDDSVAGKTGTAEYCYSQKGNGKKTHGLFIGFHPATGTPKTGIIVFSLRGVGSGAADTAGPIISVLGMLGK